MKLEQIMKDQSIDLGKEECEFLNHHPVWDGNAYTCAECGLEFRSVKRLKQTITDLSKQRIEMWEEMLRNVRFKQRSADYDLAITHIIEEEKKFINDNK